MGLINAIAAGITAVVLFVMRMVASVAGVVATVVTGVMGVPFVLNTIVPAVVRFWQAPEGPYLTVAGLIVVGFVALVALID